MELDSIIYIIIAIVLAIVNAVAQKKKKAAREQARSTSIEQTDVRFENPEFEEVGDSPYPAQEVGYAKKSNPLEMLFDESFFEEEGQPATFAPPKTSQAATPVEEVPELTDFQLKMQEVAKQYMSDAVEHPVSEFDEDSIAASAIGDALTEEEEKLAISEARTEFMKEFEVKKAIVYTEIIKPKYFSIGVNS